MPWSKADVERHSKGLSSHQQDVWVAVANNALAACIKNGGTDATCAPKAIQQANAVASKAPKVKAATMAVKTVGGKQFPASDFLVVEDPQKPDSWHLQVKRNGKADHGLMGAALASLTSPGGHRGQQYQGPQKQEAIRRLKALYKSEGMPWTASMAAFSVELAASPRESQGAWVVRHGKLFQAGAYPDKQFAMTEDELAQAVASFEPVPLDSEHRESVFDGQLGLVEAIELCENGQALCGAVRIPDWLDSLFKDAPIPVSTTWDRETKTLTGLALAKHPRVSDAAILAAFAQHNTWEGRGTLQAIHDMAARSGATCTPPSGEARGLGLGASEWSNPGEQQASSLQSLASLNSAHENQGIQAIHDMASQHGARCSAMSDRYASYVDSFAAFALSRVEGFAGRRHSTSDQAALDAAHEAIVNAGAACPGMKTGMKESRMKLFDKDWWAALFGAYAESSGGIEIVGDSADAQLATVTAELSTTTDPALRSEVDTLKKQLAEQRRVQIQAQAASFADGAVRDRRILPVEHAGIIALYIQAAEDDATHGAATFTDGATGKTTERTRVSSLEAMVAARPQHSLTVEHIITNEAGALAQGGDKAKMSDERKETLLALAPLGQAALDRKRAKSA